MFKTFRITLLVCTLLFVSLSAYQLQAMHASWDSPKWVVVYPINADGSQASKSYINGLSGASFQSISEFVKREAARHGKSYDEPVIVKLGPEVDELPPPVDPAATLLEKIWWSFEISRWADGVRQGYDGPPADIDIFVKYYDPVKYKLLEYSFGVSKMSLGVVNAFATRRMTESNNVVIVHELLHVVGAEDKYDLRTNLPNYPEGFVEPEAQPLYPQTKAEIMAGRIPVDRAEAVIPKSLKSVIIGEQTAREINWLSN